MLFNCLSFKQIFLKIFISLFISLSSFSFFCKYKPKSISEYGRFNPYKVEPKISNSYELKFFLKKYF